MGAIGARHEHDWDQRQVRPRRRRAAKMRAMRHANNRTRHSHQQYHYYHRAPTCDHYHPHPTVANGIPPPPARSPAERNEKSSGRRRGLLPRELLDGNADNGKGASGLGREAPDGHLAAAAAVFFMQLVGRTRKAIGATTTLKTATKTITTKPGIESISLTPDQSCTRLRPRVLRTSRSSAGQREPRIEGAAREVLHIRRGPNGEDTL